MFINIEINTEVNTIKIADKITRLHVRLCRIWRIIVFKLLSKTTDLKQLLEARYF